MALNGNVLGDAIKAAVDAAVSDGGQPNRTTIFRAIGNAIVAHIQANAVVTVTSVTGVTAGAGVSGPGTGTVG